MATIWMEAPSAVNGTTGDTSLILWDGHAGTSSPAFNTATKQSDLGAWKLAGAATPSSLTKNGIMADAGRRLTFWVNIAALPASGTGFELLAVLNNTGTSIFRIFVRNVSGTTNFTYNNSTGTTATVTGSFAPVANTWYRFSLSYKITSTTNYTVKTWVNGTLDITATNTNATLAGTGTNELRISALGASTEDVYFQHLYLDDGTGVDDVGDIRTTAKRPNANGTSNQFTTQIGAGGSGYGTGHSPQVNERPASTTNGWQVPATTGTKTEGYAIEANTAGDLDISAYTQVAYLGWVNWLLGGSGATPTNHLLVNGVSTTISTTGVSTAITDSATYPATSVVIGMDASSGSGKVTELLECGIVVAYSPTVALSVTIAGTGTSSATFSLATALSDTLAGVGTLSATMSATTALTSTIAGVGTLSATMSATTALTGECDGVGTLTATLSTTGGPVSLTGECDGVGTLTGTMAASTALTGECDGVGTLSGTLSASLALPATTLAGVGMLTGAMVASLAISGECDGVGTLTATISLSTALAVTIPGGGTVTETFTLVTALTSTLAGTGTLSATMVASLSLTSTMSGVGTLTASISESTSLTATLSGTSDCTGTMMLTTALLVTCAGVGTVNGLLTLPLPLFLIYAGVGTLSGTMSTHIAIPSIATTWIARDMLATWITRDGRVTWNTRDEQAAWNTRDEQITWKARKQ